MTADRQKEYSKKYYEQNREKCLARANLQKAKKRQAKMVEKAVDEAIVNIKFIKQFVDTETLALMLFSDVLTPEEWRDIEGTCKNQQLPN